MCRTPAVLAILIALPALAQGDLPLFGGAKPPLFREQEIDRRFTASKVNKLLMTGKVEGLPCQQLVGALFVALGELAPYLHKKDENFILDPMLARAFGQQLDSERFTGSVYLTSMVRRTLIDGRIPAEWLQTATKVNETVQIIDLAKLKYLAAGVRHIDSAYFTFEELRRRRANDVNAAVSVSKGTASTAFRDTYLDREVAWANLTLIDISEGKGKRGLVARLQWKEAVPEDNLYPSVPGVPHLFAEPKRETAIITAALSDQQFAGLYSLTRGSRVLVKGRLFEMNPNLSQVGLRDAQLFIDRDWSKGAVLADPNAVLRCNAAVNDVTGTGPVQPGASGNGWGADHFIPSVAKRSRGTSGPLDSASLRSG